MSAADQSLQWSKSVDVALSEKSPHLGGAQARLSLWKDPWMQPYLGRCPGKAEFVEETLDVALPGEVPRQG